MVVKVVDASAAAAILFGEDEAEAVADRLEDATLVAPRLIWSELANTCLKKCRRQPDERTDLLRSFELRGGLLIEELPVDYGAAARIALDDGLSAYDASYLWLAEEIDAELVTLDRRLAAAAKVRGR